LGFYDAAYNRFTETPNITDLVLVGRHAIHANTFQVNASLGGHWRREDKVARWQTPGGRRYVNESEEKPRKGIKDTSGYRN